MAGKQAFCKQQPHVHVNTRSIEAVLAPIAEQVRLLAKTTELAKFGRAWLTTAVLHAVSAQVSQLIVIDEQARKINAGLPDLTSGTWVQCVGLQSCPHAFGGQLGLLSKEIAGSTNKKQKGGMDTRDRKRSCDLLPFDGLSYQSFPLVSLASLLLLFPKSTVPWAFVVVAFLQRPMPSTWQSVTSHRQAGTLLR